MTSNSCRIAWTASWVAAALLLGANGAAAQTTFNHTGAKVNWTVPTTGTYRVTAIGAQGGSASVTYSGGRGAQIVGEFTFTKDQQLQIYVGGAGTGGSSHGGGGGGTFLLDQSNNLLLAAGGGGGVSQLAGQNGTDASTTNAAYNASGIGGTYTPVLKTTGIGFGGAVSASGYGSGGGGFDGDGADDTPFGNGGKGRAGGFTGGIGSDASGGFGGGGSGDGYSLADGGGGGGGGYSGGDGGRVAGGGGSHAHSSATNVVATAGVGTGNGTLTIALVTPPESDIAVSISESADPVDAGSGAGNLTYTVTVTNNGPTDATGLSLSRSLTLPSGVSTVSETASSGTSLNAGTGAWTIGALTNGSSATLTVVLTVGATTATGTDVISISASVTALDQADSTSGNDSATERTSVGGGYVVTRTQRVINNFIARRGDMITAAEPNLTLRLDRRGTGGGGGTFVEELGFTATGVENDYAMSLSTSLSEMANARMAADAMASGDANARQGAGTNGVGDLVLSYAASEAAANSYALSDTEPLVVPEELPSRFDVWVQGSYVHVDDETRESDVGLLFVGADYLINPSLLVGVLGQLDWVDEADDTNGTSADGWGWMAGPYVVARLHQNLLFDGRVAWGQSDNNVDPLGLYTDSFDTTRWLARGQLTGDFRAGGLTFSPHGGVIYFEEHQNSYTDSLGNAIPSQTISLGRVTFGPSVSYTFQGEGGFVVEPHIGIEGIWDFDKAEVVDLSTGLAAGSSEDLRARVEGGLSLRPGGGWSLSASGFYDGIGVDGLEAYGGSAKLRIPLQR